MSAAQDEILFIGVNKFASQEASALQKTGARVTLIKDAPTNDAIVVDTGAGRKTYDLSTALGIKSFVASLGLPSAQAAKLESILDTAPFTSVADIPDELTDYRDALSKASAKEVADFFRSVMTDIRDELAQLVLVWAKGEKGGEVPGRLVLSGHSGGTLIWGAEAGFENGILMSASLTKLAEAMPKAAAQVEDLAISACYCGGETTLNQWKQGFPNVRTVLAYFSKAPSGADGGSSLHLQRWEKLTRGSYDALKPEQFSGLGSKSKNVATWSVKHGYLIQGQRESVDVVRRNIASFQPQYAKYFSGEKSLPKSEPNELRDYYNSLHDLAGRSGIPDPERKDLLNKIAQTIRLIKYESIRVKFQKNYGGKLGLGFMAVKLPSPNTSRMARKDIFQSISELEKAIAAASPVPESAKKAHELMTQGLRDLGSALIPANWIG